MPSRGLFDSGGHWLDASPRFYRLRKSRGLARRFGFWLMGARLSGWTFAAGQRIYEWGNYRAD